MFGRLKDTLAAGKNRLSGNTDLLEGICAACVFVGCADGEMDDNEAGIALDRLLTHDPLSKVFSASQIEQAFEWQFKRAKQGMTGRIGLRREIEQVGSKSSDADVEMVLVIAIDVAAADGDIGPKEQAALKTIGQALGLNADRYLV